jgi:hypothetical protein
MDNSVVIFRLETCVAKLEADIDILEEKLDESTSDTPTLIQQQRELNRLLAEMIAEKNSLETVINERTAPVVSSIPALRSDQVAKFAAQMNILNQVIQADQGFDRIVGVARGINAASAEIGEITALRA